jgi:drug/metabolite transporter (DMT)-like permease
MDPQTAVVVLGLASAAAWGSADFGGGIAGRRAPLFGVVLSTQLIGCGLALILAAVRGEPAPGVRDATIAVAAGVVGAIGIWALYRGLSTGRMGVVAPISGVLSAVVPVGAGIVLQGAPGPAALAGIALALVAVVLVSASPSAGGPPDRRVAGLPADAAIGVLAGLSLGLLNLLIGRLTPGSVFAPLVVVRLTEAAFIGTIILAARPVWRVPRPVWPLAALVGGLDMAGNGFFILAAQAGRLDIAAILSSLYPVTTLILAAAILRERLVGVHAIGVVVAVVAIVLVRLG